MSLTITPVNLISHNLRGVKSSSAKGCSDDVFAGSQNSSASSQPALRVSTILAREVGMYLATKKLHGQFKKKIQMSYSKGRARETHLPDGRNKRRPHCLYHPSWNQKLETLLPT